MNIAGVLMMQHRLKKLVAIVITFASTTLGTFADVLDQLPKDRFYVWPDSLWMRVAQSRMIVVATARRTQDADFPCYHLDVKEVLKGEAKVNELILQLHDPYNDEINAQVLDG